MKTKGTILIADDNEEILVALKMYLEEHFSRILTEKDPGRVLKHMQEEPVDVFVLDMNFRPGASSGEEGISLMKSIRHIDPLAIVVFITAYGDVDLAVKAMKEGATDFIQKPWNDHKLLATVGSAIQLSESRHEVGSLRQKQQHFNERLKKDHQMITGNSPAMKQVLHLIDRVASTDTNVLILGENGTGKELAARAIHMKSERKNEVFLGVDLGALSESLFESELFGHVRGAFTDAKENKPGRFEIASGGTLFLDEVANIPPNLQSKLLSVIENRMVTRLGSNHPVPVDVRIISATNRDLDRMIADNAFRKDLLFRLNTIRIDLPPLRERIEDLPLLVNYFLEKLAEKYNRISLRVSRSGMNKLMKHAWPGNVRELQHTLEKAVILTDDNMLMERDFLFKSVTHPEGNSRIKNLADKQKEYILETIRKNGGNISRSARQLNISRRTLYNKLKKYES